MVTLRQLRYLQALASHGHFGRAARACAVSQPALSMQIKELEKELGVPLVERANRDMRLTPAGREVVRRADQILRDVRDLKDYASEHREDLGPSLTLGVIPTLGPYFLPAVLPRLQRQYPDLDLRLHETRTESLVDGVQEGEIDAALLALPIDAPKLETMALFEDRFLLAVPQSRAMPRSMRTEDLEREPLLLLEEGHCLRDQTLALCSAAHPAALRRFGATSLTTILQMVASGYGSTLVPEIAVPSEIRPQSQLKLIRFKAPEPAREIGLAWRASSPRRRQLQKLGSFLKESWQENAPRAMSETAAALA
ncbi:LysR substrate-binding domain-containing protein [Methyloligella sp. 2.7D]|uniref:LysR substrate-binding domain-containing protein n=1 Tax=unclassified Methyloligella TaxID=2625955 RepID=UPI00157C8F77|nr:LysR substrate-binding domain-containing protein [Methyloligella sp. GL2]QKP78000.1 LysR family transcriptional regulator [Methyloligella sp. GL2]